MKKIVSFLLCIVLLVGTLSLTACVEERAENEILITRWASTYEKAAFEEWGKKFTSKYPEYKIKWQFNSYAEYFNKVQFDLLDDAAGDVVFLSTWGWGKYRNSTVFVDLNEVASLADTITKLNVNATKQFMNDNQRLAMPIGTTTRRIAVNASDFPSEGANSAASLQARQSSFTMSEFESILGNIADENGKKYATKIDHTDLVFLLTASAGAPIVNNETNKVEVNNDAGRAAVSEFVKYMQSGYQVPFAQNSNGGIGGTYDEAMLSSGQNTVLTSYTGPWGFPALKNAGKNLVTIPIVKATGGQDTMLVTYNNMCVPKASVRKEGAYKFIEWACSKEAQLEFAKFSDLPTNQEAYDIVTGGKDKSFPASIYGAFNIGKDNIYYMDGLSDDFAAAFSSAMSNLLNTNYKMQNGWNESGLAAAVNTFCETLKNAENKL